MNNTIVISKEDYDKAKEEIHVVARLWHKYTGKPLVITIASVHPDATVFLVGDDDDATQRL